MNVRASYYPADQDAAVVAFEDQPLSIDADEDFEGPIVRIETGPPARDDEPWGSAGVCIEIPASEAFLLAVRIMELADPKRLERIVDALTYAAEDYAERASFEDKSALPDVSEADDFRRAALEYSQVIDAIGRTA
jgi:hypothetical protein